MEWVVECLAAALRPVERMALPEWMEKNVMLRDEESPGRAGAYRRDKSIPMGKLFAAFNAGDWRKLFVKKSSRTAFTLHCLGDMAQHIATRPQNMIFVIDSEKEVKRISRKRFRPMLEDCAATKGLWSEGEDEQTTLEYTFPGMSLWMVGAGSAGAVANKASVRNYADEVDKHATLAGEADTLDLLDQRGKGIRGKVTIGGSTPTTERGPIHREHVRGSRHVYEVPCPHCGEQQELRWEGVKYSHCRREGGGYDMRRVLRETYYECRRCGGKIRDEDKPAMLEAGEWVPTHYVEVEGVLEEGWEPRVMSAHLSDLYSVDEDSSWGEIAVEWIKAQGDPRKLHNFQNGRLGLAVRETVMEVRPEGVRKLMGSYLRGTMPEVPCMLTAQFDNQGSEVVKWMVSGWLPGGTHYVVDWGTLDARVQVDEIMARRFECGGRMLSPQKGIMDEGGVEGTTWEVREFCAARQGRLIASKGQAGRQINHLARIGRASIARGGMVMVPVIQYDDDAFKRLVYVQRIGGFDAAKVEAEGLSRLWLPADTTPQLVRELSGEHLRRVNGRTEWVASPPNDWGDCVKMGEVLWNVIGGDLRQ